MSRKEIILQTAIELFAEKGYNGTSTTEIVEKAGVAQGTLFYHYKNKEGILLTILDNLLNEYLVDIEEIAQDNLDGLAAIEAILRNSIFFRQTRDLELLVLMRDFPADLIQPESSLMDFVARFFNRTHELLKNCLERGQQDGTIRKLSADKYAHILLGFLSGMDRHVLLAPLLSPSLSEEMVEFCCRALAPSAKNTLDKGSIE